MKNKFCIYTTVFPKSKRFFKDFIKSINNQSDKNFDLVLCLNGTDLNQKFLNLIKVSFKLIYCDLPMNRARVFALKKLINKYEVVILIDADDYMSNKRCETIKKSLKRNDFIVNNLYTFSKNNPQPKQWIKYPNRKKIKLNDIYSSNFIGLSNLTIKTNALKKIINKINTDLIALDWCIAKLLLIYGFKGLFLRNVITYYRQYNDNVSNLENFKKKQVLKDLTNKIDHYKYFKKFKIYNSEEIINLENKLFKIKKIKKNDLKKIVNKKKAWWSHI